MADDIYSKRDDYMGLNADTEKRNKHKNGSSLKNIFASGALGLGMLFFSPGTTKANDIALASALHQHQGASYLEAIVEHDDYAMQEQQKVEQADPKTLLYSKAMNAKVPDEKIKLLEDYLKAYDDSQYHKFAYKELAFNYYGKKNFDAVIANGDKALTYSGLDDDSKAQLLLVTGEAYVVSKDKKDTNKALEYAGEARKIATAGNLNKNYLDAASKLESIAKGGGSKAGAPQSSAFNDATNLYKQKKYAEADKAFAALDQKDAKVIYSRGLANAQLKNYDKAIDYLLDASILAPDNYKQAKTMAESIYLANSKGYERDPNYIKLANEIKDRNNILTGATADYNKEYGDKELSDADKRRADKALKNLDAMKQEISELDFSRQKIINGSFNRLVEEAKKRAGIR